MQHLNDEALARLVDEAPGPHEAEHLRGCLVCRRGLAEMRTQTEALAALADPQPPAGAWAALEARLLEEKLVGAPAPAAAWWHRPPLRAAAALALFLAGGAAGAALWSGRAADERVAAAVDARTQRPASPLASVPEVTYVTEEIAEPAPSSSGSAFAVNRGPDAETVVPAPTRIVPRSARRAGEAEDAARELAEAQAAFVAALRQLAAAAHPQSGNDAPTRLAALDRLVALTADALARVPGDPVINGYHLAAVAERDALRRQVEQDQATEWF